MPTYEYECTACGHRFECFQSITAGSKRKCPACGKLKLRRLIGAGAGVIFKGSGFYETDYKRSSTGKTSPKKEQQGPDSGKDTGGDGGGDKGSKEDKAPDSAGKDKAAD